MATSHTNGQPELWLRPSPTVSIEVLLTFVEAQRLTATPRLGKRTAEHPKGYAPGQVVTLRVIDESDVERLSRKVVIEDIVARPLEHFGSDDLHGTLFYTTWQDVQRDLSFFEKRAVMENEDSSIVEYSYLPQ